LYVKVELGNPITWLTSINLIMTRKSAPGANYDLTVKPACVSKS